MTTKKQKKFFTRHKGGDFYEYEADDPEGAAQLYAKDFGMGSGELVQVKYHGYFSIRTETIYVAKKYGGLA